MKDRFKFRVWCENNQEWEKDTILISNKNMYEIRNDKFTKYTNIDPKNHIINFCTGLKDKNGKLIYEKDILLSPDNDEPYMVIVEWDNEKGYIVKAWNGKEFEYALSDDTLESLKYFQIIGNEFENPELLEGNNE